jgi:hypothetical protein
MQIRAWGDTESTEVQRQVTVYALVAPNCSDISLSLPADGVCILLIKLISGSHTGIQSVMAVLMRSRGATL